MDRESRKKLYGIAAIKQQELPAWQPILTPVAVIGILALTGLIFLPIGVVLLDYSKQVKSVTFRYDNVGNCASVTSSMNYTQLPQKCVVNFTLNEDMNPPIYFYYGVKGFFQNQRSYVKSFSNEQMRQQSVSTSKLQTQCDPLTYENGKTLLACGLVPNSFFTDRFSMSVGGSSLCSNCVAPSSGNWSDVWHTFNAEPNWSMKGIAWQSDLDALYTNVTPSAGETKWGLRQQQIGLPLPDINNEDFVVWMRLSALPDFNKLHRVINNRVLKSGDQISVEIYSWFPVQEFKGEKSFTLSTTTWLGSKNFLLAYLFITVASFNFAVALLFVLRLQFGARSLANMDLFTWKNAIPE